MVIRHLDISIFNTKVFLAKMLVVVIAVPILSVMIPIWALRGKADWKEYRALFSVTQWREVFGVVTECLIGAKWFVVEPKTVDDDKFPRYCFYDPQERIVGCLFLDDAVLLNMHFGGEVISGKTLGQRYKEQKKRQAEARNRKKNNALR